MKRQRCEETVEADMDKGKVEKFKRRKREGQRRRLRELLRNANKEEDPFLRFSEFQTYSKNGLQLELCHYKTLDAKPDLLEWCLNLCQQNMEAAYGPVWGWDREDKKKQLNHPASRFIIAFEKEEQGSPVAYAQYRYEDEEGSAVMYLYELQLERHVHRKGLGRFLMTLLELMATCHGLDRMMLTVLKSGTAANELYRSLGFVLDESSPSVACPWEDDCGYEILCKRLGCSIKENMPTVGSDGAADKIDRDVCVGGGGSIEQL